MNVITKDNFNIPFKINSFLEKVIKIKEMNRQKARVATKLLYQPINSMTIT